MILLERYIFRQAFAQTMLPLVGMIAVLQIIQVINEVDRLVKSPQALLLMLHLAGTVIPSIIVATLPLAILVAVIHLFWNMDRDFQLAAMSSVGLGPWTFARPVLILSGFLAIGCLIISLLVEPWANFGSRRVIQEAGADAVLSTVRSQSIQELDSNLFVRINGQTSDDLLQGILIADFRNPDFETMYFAPFGRYTESQGATVLLLINGQVQRQDRRENRISVVRFRSYAFDLTDFVAQSRSVRIGPRQQSTSSLFETLRGESPSAKSLTELHRRFTDWIYLLTFAAIALGFASTAKAGPLQRSQAAVMAVAIAVAVRAAGFYALARSPNHAVFAIATYLVPVVPILVVCSLIAIDGLKSSNVNKKTSTAVEPPPGVGGQGDPSMSLGP